MSTNQPHLFLSHESLTKPDLKTAHFSQAQVDTSSSSLMPGLNRREAPSKIPVGGAVTNNKESKKNQKFLRD